MTKVVKIRHIENGYDPTANSFLVDYYFNANIIRVSDPDVTLPIEVANRFAKEFLGATIKLEQQKFYYAAMRNFVYEKKYKELTELTKDEQKDIKSIKLESITFTCARSEKEADQLRKLRVDKARKKKGLKPLPRYTCSHFEGENIYDELEIHFPIKDSRYPLDGRDIFELVFTIDLFIHESTDYLNQDFKEAIAPTKRYRITVSQRSVSTDPPRHEIADKKHLYLLDCVKEKLQLKGKTLNELRDLYFNVQES